MDEETVDSTETGVTEQVDTPIPATESPTVEAGGDESDAIDPSIDRLSETAKKRFQSLANERRKYQTESQKYQSEYQKLRQELDSLSGPRSLHEALSKNPQHLRAVLDMIEGKGAEVKDPYADFSPEVAEKFRAVDAMEAWKKEQEGVRQQEQQTYIQQNEDRLNSRFATLLKDKGYADESGNFDEAFSDALADAVRSRLSTQGDPRLATEKQVDSAFEGVIKGLQFLEKKALKTVVKQPGVPASGTGNGKVASAKVDFSLPENRIAALVAGMRG